MTQSPLVFISAAEPSGDLHAARLVRELQRRWPGARFRGLGGPALAEAGVELLEDLVGRSAMLGHALAQVPFYWGLRRRLRADFARCRPDLLITVDSFEWNLHVAKLARRQGTPVLTYSAPQLWAWGSWRIGGVRRHIDHVACFLPFEADWFGRRGVAASFVGHPLFAEHPAEPPGARSEPTDGFPTLALLPGSRDHEIDRLWRPMQAVAAQVKRRYGTARFLTAAASAAHADRLRATADPHLGIEIRRQPLDEVTRRAHLALVASGTATLQTAGRGCPMVIMYYVDPWQWRFIGRWLIRTPHLSLVNILAGRELVPEFMPFHRDVEGVTAAVTALLDDADRRGRLRHDLLDLAAPLRSNSAPVRTADLAEQLLQREARA